MSVTVRIERQDQSQERVDAATWQALRDQLDVLGIDSSGGGLLLSIDADEQTAVDLVSRALSDVGADHLVARPLSA